MADRVQKALKEWAVALRALETGEQVLLLRKGGIVEDRGRFQVEADRFFLFPTFFHQDPGMLKPEYAPWIEEVFDRRPPEGRVRIGLFAEVAGVVPVTEVAGVRAVADQHIWSAGYMEDRFYWKPEAPLFLLLLRVYRLPEPREIEMRPGYGGCTSWVDLEAELSVSGARPVLDGAVFEQKVEAIHDALSAVEA